MCELSYTLNVSYQSWNCTGGSPPTQPVTDLCSWLGVTCNDVGAVVQLAIPPQNYDSSLPISTLTKLTSLQVLNVEYGNFKGKVQSAISKLVNLRKLYLDNNALTGSVPSVLCSLPALIIIDVRSNHFRCYPYCILVSGTALVADNQLALCPGATEHRPPPLCKFTHILNVTSSCYDTSFLK